MADQALVAKRIPNTACLVDGFRFQAPEFRTYFLTHAHSDHTTGLTRGFSAGTIYCSPVTAALILHDTPRVKDTTRVVALEVGKVHTIEDSKCGSFEVTLVDANHCPGACMLVFDVPFIIDEGEGGVEKGKAKKRIVHTGDFRFHAALHGRHPLLLSSSSLSSSSSASTSSTSSLLPSPPPLLPVDTLLLDTTYAHPRHAHPRQELAIAACAEFCRRETAKSSLPLLPSSWSAPASSSSAAPQPLLLPRPLFVFGSYRIGKERLYLGVAEELGWKLWVPPQKRGLLELLGLLSDENDDDDDIKEGGGQEGQKRKKELHLHRRYPRSLLADSPTEAVLHVAPMGASLTPPALLSRIQPGGEAAASGCGRVVGIRSTGWTFRKPKKGGAREKAAENENDLCAALVTSYSPLPGVTVAGVPYSEHSSFPELRAAVAAMKPRRLVPTVTGGTAGDREAIVERFSDLLDRRRDRSRLDFFFSAAAVKKKGGEEEEVPEAKKAEGRENGGGGDEEEDIKVKEERGSDCEDDENGDKDDSWGPPRGGDDWALDDDEEMKEEVMKEEKATAAGGSGAAPPPQNPFDLSSVDAAEQRRIFAEIQAVATAEKLLQDLKQGGGEGGGGGSSKRRRQPTLAAFAAATAASKKKNK